MVRDSEGLSSDYSDFHPDFLDLDEVKYELMIRGIQDIDSPSEQRRALRNILSREQDPEGLVVEAVIASLNPDGEFSSCWDKLEMIRVEFNEHPLEEHVRRRTRARLQWLKTRLVRNRSREIGDTGRFDTLLRDLETFLQDCNRRETSEREIDEMLADMSLTGVNEYRREPVRTSSMNRSASEGRQPSSRHQMELQPSRLGNSREKENEFRQVPVVERRIGEILNTTRNSGGPNGSVEGLLAERYLGRTSMEYEPGLQVSGSGLESRQATGAVPKGSKDPVEGTGNRYERNDVHQGTSSSLENCLEIPVLSTRRSRSQSNVDQHHQITDKRIERSLSSIGSREWPIENTPRLRGSETDIHAMRTQGPYERATAPPMSAQSQRISNDRPRVSFEPADIARSGHYHSSFEPAEIARSGQCRSSFEQAEIARSGQYRSSLEPADIARSRQYRSSWEPADIARPEQYRSSFEQAGIARSGQYRSVRESTENTSLGQNRRSWEQANMARSEPNIGSFARPIFDRQSPNYSDEWHRGTREWTDSAARPFRHPEQYREWDRQYGSRREETESGLRRNEWENVERHPNSNWHDDYEPYRRSYFDEEGPRNRPTFWNQQRYNPQRYRDSHYKSPIAKWNITKFDGSEKELPRFLSNVRQWAMDEGLSKEELFYNKMHLFTGDAADFLTTSNHIRTWDQLVLELTRYCLGSTSDRDTLRKIEQKRQRDENAGVFCTRMEILLQSLRRPLEDQEMVEIIIYGLRPEVRQALAGVVTIRDVKELKVAAQRAEKLLQCSNRDFYEVEAVRADPQKKPTFEKSKDHDKRDEVESPEKKGHCYRCGIWGHHQNTCKFSRAKCHKCEKAGITSPQCSNCSGNGKGRSQ